MSETPRIRVAALIAIGGRVVVVRHRKSGQEYHLLPGGGVEFGETLADALIREVAEETGLSCVVGRPVVINDTIDPAGTRHVVNITFLCEVAEPLDLAPPADDARVVDVELVEARGLSDLDLRPPIAATLRSVLADPLHYEATYEGGLFV